MGKSKGGVANEAFEENESPPVVSRQQQRTPRRETTPPKPITPPPPAKVQPVEEEVSVDDGQQRDTWGNPIEFLMSCISLSVGLGNIWRFPFTAVDNNSLFPLMILF